MSSDPADETRAVAARYARRAPPGRYSMLQPDVWQTVQERQRALLRLLVRLGLTDVERLRVLEVGCGAGGNLLEWLRLGVAPEHLAGVELLPQRHAIARQVLPASVTLWQGDASTLAIAKASLLPVPEDAAASAVTSLLAWDGSRPTNGSAAA